MNKKIFRGILVLVLIGFLMNTCSAEARIDSVSFDPNYIEPGNEVNIYVKFHEQPVRRDILRGAPSTVAADNPDMLYKAELAPADDITKNYIIIKESKRNIGHLFIGESWTTPFSIKVKEDAPITTYKLDFILKYYNLNETVEEIARTYEFDMSVRGIVKFDVKTANVMRLGDINNLVLTVSNVGGGSARHVSVSLNASAPFTTLENSEAYLGDFNGLETKDAKFKISVGTDASPKAYEIPVQISYIDSNGSTSTIKKNVGVWVEDEPKVSLALEGTTKFVKGSKGKVTINVYNKGFSEVKFLTLQLLPANGYTITSQDTSYIGNLDSDDSEAEDFEIAVSSMAPNGKLSLPVTLEYTEKNTNRVHTLNENLTISVMTSAEYAQETSQQGTLSRISGVIMILPVLVVAYVLLWLVYKIATAITTYLNRRLFSK